ncbi:MAG: dUTP diphosphatase [Candidatus Omnitrophica bacterium CG12_big_fil_rev_8_21_14_0_65_43_15]|uniref:Deoxyuridine 5'-triphosphate nucleotidohydrolase n=1 Tax=Candidatus Taenaricola geysiri TaxID=1974752 RepID=A0A2J0LFG1_9BACT|nr:MAG: deoxyuridine 5'-triphosphate nucleotidohydrolase [Candidatus Omnitrophica bacterium CG1_02_43_210]PIR65453.1 MAG: dUTP diphosphatase [Candidatus Omnitrophica bacterium CG10_big_fil_rev_8_21_14_0_10_43_8]PIV11614.1 MAG: dUTP diphosphatase [Candidatus Omnitrophica bacterium CG03_land_8_20_14_0_80_43_22]PIW66588.1 MAG: dUTP diphosphatase [Candidatus Omnitrophica bacterium CG12_big_fil_rev_8_21_14_0_65_43_15]PIW80371.1 MAG: dUTP diphosphatase [Candidatus Omnitrophica bacterium CG_4_8_14_3_u
MKKIKIFIKRRKGCEDLPLPEYMSHGSSGMDLYADVQEDVLLNPGERRLISAGIFLSMPEGFEAQTRPRSGLALKNGITLVNSPGTIDSDYRGLVNLIVANISNEPFTIRRGMRIAQMVFQEVVRAEIEEAAELDETVRAQGGFGHTGV